MILESEGLDIIYVLLLESKGLNHDLRELC